jgi:hypothetical protein
MFDQRSDERDSEQDLERSRADGGKSVVKDDNRIWELQFVEQIEQCEEW